MKSVKAGPVENPEPFGMKGKGDQDQQDAIKSRQKAERRRRREVCCQKLSLTAPIWASIAFCVLDLVLFLYIVSLSWGFYSDGASEFRVMGSPPYTTRVVTFGLFWICASSVRTLEDKNDEGCSNCYALTPNFIELSDIGEAKQLITIAQMSTSVTLFLIVGFALSLVIEMILSLKNKSPKSFNRKIIPLLFGVLPLITKLVIYISGAVLASLLGTKLKNLDHFHNMPVSSSQQSGFTLSIIYYLLTIQCNVLALICLVHRWKTGRRSKDEGLEVSEREMEKFQRQVEEAKDRMKNEIDQSERGIDNRRGSFGNRQVRNLGEAKRPNIAEESD